MSPKSNYDKHPSIPVSASPDECGVGWRSIIERLQPFCAEGRCTLAVECYPSTFAGIVKDALLEGLHPAGVIYTPELLRDPRQSKVDFLEARVPTAWSEGEKSITFGANGDMWLKVRIDGVEGWIHSEEDFEAVGLPQAG